VVIRAQSLEGTVADPSGAVVTAAAIELTNEATGVTARAESDAEGRFHFLSPPAGEYRLLAVRTGFAPIQKEGLRLHAGVGSEIALVLPLADAAESIDVNAEAPLLQAARGSAGFTVEQRKVVNLPLDGRNFVPLIALSPGVNLPPGSVFPRINGSRPRVSEYIYDGISVLQPEPGQVAYFPVIDAIEEFRVETNSYSAEYGRSNGGVILVQQKSGSNELHGTLFEFFRHERLNARNLFAVSGPKPRFRRNQYGFVLGGPIRRNNTFFFADWQGTRLATGVVRAATVPPAQQRQGIFARPIFDPLHPSVPFAQNTIPLSRRDAAALAAAERYPLPASAGANNLRRTGADTTAADQFDGRIDRYFGSRHRVFARAAVLRDGTRPFAPLPDGSGAIGYSYTQAASVAGEHNWTISPSALNQLRFGHTRRSIARDSMRGGGGAGIPNVPVTAFGDVYPSFEIAGLQPLGPPANANSRLATSVTQWTDTFSRAHGRHSWKAGVDVRREALDVLQPASPAGLYQFTAIPTAGLNTAGSGDSFASFLLGQVTRFSIDSQPETLRPRAMFAEAFLQDDLRLTARLSVNAGVRYTLNFPSTVVDDKTAIFDLRAQRLDLRSRTARELEKTNFAPRLGTAYRLGGALVLRAGYGLTWIEQAGLTTPFTTPLFPYIQTLSQQSIDNNNPAFVLSRGPSVTLSPPSPDSGIGQGVFATQRDNGSGYAQQWNFTIQKTAGAVWSFEAGYFGSKLTRLGVPDVNMNQLTVEQLGHGSRLFEQADNPFRQPGFDQPSLTRAQLLRPYPRFTTVALYRNNTGHSTYHSLQTRVERRFARRVTFVANYTFSRLIDDAGAVFDSAILSGPSAIFQAADSFNKRLEKDVSTGDVPHNFSSGFVVELPRGWQMSGLARAHAGSPIAVTQATNWNAFAGFGIQRPKRTREPGLAPEARSTARWFDTAAFTEARQFEIGNSSRNPVRGPGYRAVDVMIGKTFAVTERMRAELRLEAFNVLNTPPLGAPNGILGAPAFGSITTALDPRVFEAVLKLHY
jgi:hypothetical protein